MSTAFAVDPVRRPTLPAASAPSRERRPDLEVVAAPAVRRARPRFLAAGLLVAGAGCVLTGQLLLSIQTAAGAYTVGSLQATSESLSRQQQVATEALEVLASPQHLAARATDLGMVPSVSPAYLRVPDGRVLGSAHPARSTSAAVALVPDALLTGH